MDTLFDWCFEVHPANNSDEQAEPPIEDGEAETAPACDAFDDLFCAARQVAAKLLEDLDVEDKLGNLELQDLMARFNQAETLASSVIKKTDDTANAVIGKV